MKPGNLAALAGMVLFATFSTASAEASWHFGGFYKVTSSTDPLFPATSQSEYFLDFGRGIEGGKLSGSVAVSVRRNPHVRVRILAWEFLPNRGDIVLGNTFAEGSRDAVALGVWRLRSMTNGAIFERGNFQIVLQRADPNDY